MSGGGCCQVTVDAAYEFSVPRRRMPDSAERNLTAIPGDCSHLLRDTATGSTSRTAGVPDDSG